MSFFDYPSASGDRAPDPTAFLADAGDDDWDTIRAHAELRRVAAGDTVIDHGAVDRSLYIVVDGTLEATVVEGRRGRSRRVSKIEAGTMIGEIAFFDGRPRSAAVRAVTDATLLRLSFDAFKALAAKQPALGQAILLDIGRVLASRLRDVESLHSS